ncbi:MAG: enoyl-CoA hydratase/isomerase family protein [Chloroflexi bacterium]|nr:enoyl-CoA hydratase/isomerase family protein [Chloroflexota bacterium]
MAYENLLYGVKQGVATITFNRPAVMNALSPALLLELKAALLEAEKDESVGVVVLTGAGRAFSAGVDLKALKGATLEDKKRVRAIALDVIDTMQSMCKVILAMVRGYCLTGALELVFGCDLIVASEEARFGDTHAKWGLRPRWGGSQHLMRTVGIMKAREMSFTAEMLTAQEAERIGLINKAVPEDKLEETVQEMAQKLLANSPGSIAAYKYLFNRGMKGTLEEGLKLEETEFDIRDSQERMQKFGKKG